MNFVELCGAINKKTAKRRKSRIIETKSRIVETKNQIIETKSHIIEAYRQVGTRITLPGN